MSKTLYALLFLAVLGTATPALAQYQQPYYRPYYLPNNAVRLEIGGATLSSPGICTNGASQSGNCANSSPFAWQALLLSGDLDLAFGGGPLNVTLGAHELAAPYYSGNPSIFEPSAGLTFKFAPQARMQPRLTLAGALLVGDDGSTGGAVRFGGGLTFYGRAPVGLAVDLIVDIGSFAGYEVTVVELALGPEFRF
jgi:hypothetical protein